MHSQDDVQDDGFGLIKPTRSVVEQDLRKWAAFLASGQKRTLAWYEGKWVCLSLDNLWRNDVHKPFQISKGYKRDDVLLAGQAMTVTDRMPEDWESQSWSKLIIVGDCYEILGDVEIVALWDVAEQKWTYGSDIDIERSGLADVQAALIGDIVTERRIERVNHIKLDSYLAVHVVYLSRTHIVTEEQSVNASVGRVTLDEYREKLRKYPTQLDTLYRPFFEAGIKKFANDMIVSDDFVCMDNVVDILLAEMPNVFQAKRFGPQEQGFGNQLSRVFKVLRDIHGVAAFPIPTGKSSWSGYEANRKDIKFQPRTPEIGKEEVEKLRAEYQRDPLAAFKGSFWKQWEPLFLYEDEEPPETGSTVLAKVGSLPTDAMISEVVAFKPEAAELMKRWRDLLDRSLPDWQSMRIWGNRISSPRSDSHAEWLKTALKDAERGFSADTLASIDYVLRSEQKQTEYNCHIAVNDAAIALAIAYDCEPRGGILMSPLGTHIVNGLDEEGLPVLEDAFPTTSRNRFHYRLLNRKFDFWNWPLMIPHLGGVLAKTEKIDLGHTLFDMKLHGHLTAVITDFEEWSAVDLTQAHTIADLQLLANSIYMDRRNGSSLFVTEKVPLKADQRFFIVDGHVIASASIDKHLNTLDSTGKRLDERVRVHDAKNGERSQIDRQTSAALARKARLIASDLKKHGVLEGAIDVGMSDRGAILTWVTPIDGSDLGTVSIERYVAGFTRKRKAMREPLKTRILKSIDGLIEEQWLRDKCREVIDRNLENLPAIVEHQYDLASQKSSSSDVFPENFMAGVAPSIILTALLETPAGKHVQQETEQ
jgi:hypothetical protein